MEDGQGMEEIKDMEDGMNTILCLVDLEVLEDLKVLGVLEVFLKVLGDSAEMEMLQQCWPAALLSKLNVSLCAKA